MLGFVGVPGSGLGAGGRGSRRRLHRCRAFSDNLIGVHYLVFSGSLEESDVRKAAAGAKEAGYDVLELPMMDVDMDTRMIKGVLDEYGLVSTGSLGLWGDADISSTDLEAVKKGEEVLQAALSNTEALGSKFLGGVIYSALTKYAGPPTEEGIANSISVLKPLAQRASSLGIKLGIENANRFETNLLNTVEDSCRFIDKIGEDSLVVHADTYHMNIEEDNMANAIRANHERIGYMHVGSSHRGYLGSGSVDFPSVFEALADVDYSGVITFESFSARIVHPKLSSSLAIWKEKWVDSADVAIKAREFIRKEMAAAVRK